MSSNEIPQDIAEAKAAIAAAFADLDKSLDRMVRLAKVPRPETVRMSVAVPLELEERIYAAARRGNRPVPEFMRRALAVATAIEGEAS